MIKNPLTCLDRYDPSGARAPVWEGDTLYNESVLLVEDADGRAQAPLLYPPEEILSVRDYTLKTTYAPGRDWSVSDGQICRVPGSPLPCFPYEEFYCLNNPPADSVMNYAFGRHILVGPGHVFQPRVVNVTYTHKGAWRWQKPAFKGDRLPRTLEKLRRGQPLTFVFYGDSVVSGDEVTSFLNLEPHTPIWSEMFCRRLEEAYGSPIRLVDTAVGGTRMEWGLEHLQTEVADYHPDLAVIGFGNNDRFSPAEYKEKLAAMVADLRCTCPDTEVILMDPLTPNRFIARGDDGYMWNVFQPYYAQKNLELEQEISGAAALEINRPHLQLQEIKRFHDMTANNINHPNDWFYRVVAQIASRLLIPG